MFWLLTQVCPRSARLWGSEHCTTNQPEVCMLIQCLPAECRNLHALCSLICSQHMLNKRKHSNQCPSLSDLTTGPCADWPLHLDLATPNSWELEQSGHLGVFEVPRRLQFQAEGDQHRLNQPRVNCILSALHRTPCLLAPFPPCPAPLMPLSKQPHSLYMA